MEDKWEEMKAKRKKQTLMGLNELKEGIQMVIRDVNLDEVSSVCEP